MQTVAECTCCGGVTVTGVTLRDRACRCVPRRSRNALCAVTVTLHATVQGQSRDTGETVTGQLSRSERKRIMPLNGDCETAEMQWAGQLANDL
jgi:hypothetical protein